MAKILTDIFPNGLRLEDLPKELPPQAPDVQLRVAISDAGITPPDEIIFDGQLHRFSTNGKSRDKSGWYVAYDGKVPAGAFGDWRMGVDCTWRAEIGRELSIAEQMQHSARMRELKAKRDKELQEMRENAAIQAAEIWESAQLASDEHPYIKRKGISNPGWRIASDGRLIAPMMIDGEIAGLQYISEDGTKMFMKGSKTGGAWWLVGSLNTDGPVYLVEGVADAGTVFEATGQPVAVAYSAGNLTAVAQELRKRVGPVREIVIVADNDESGTGQRESQRASEAAQCRVVMPPDIGDINDYFRAGGDVAGLLNPPKQSTSKYKLRKASEMTDLPPVRWQIKKVLPAQDVVAIYGPPGAGKSFMALDMAACIAEGRDWMGFRTRQANVVYLVLEAANGFSGRLKAWQMHHERQLPDSFHVITQTSFAFSSPSDIGELIAGIQETIGSSQMGLVVFIDTLARAMGAFEENDNNDMGKVINCADVISRSLGCTVAMIAHPGKDSTKGLRGGSALLGGLDTVIQLQKDSFTGMRTWTIEKQKEGEDGLSGAFNLKLVVLGQDEDGDDITSAVVVKADEAEPEELAAKESNALAKARQHYEAAVMKFGRFDRRTGRPFVSWDAWNEYSRTQPHESDGARRKYMSTAKKLLLDNGYIQEADGGYEPTEHPYFAGAFVGLKY